MLLFFHSKSWEREKKNGRAAIMIKREEEEEDVERDREEEECVVDGSEDVVDGLKSVGECNSFPTGATKLRRFKHLMSLSWF